MEPQPSTGSSACERRFMFIFLIASLIGCCDIIEQILHHREQLQVHLERITVVNEESLQQTSTVENISGSVDVSTGQFRRKTSQAFVDDDWKYHPMNRYLQEAEDDDNNNDDDNQNENTEDDDNNNDDQEGKNNDDDCIRERTYLAELINHMISNPPEEWSTTEIILGCCLASVALSSVIVALCCVYGCCSAYCCCCCCEGKGRKGKQSSTWDGDTAASQYGSDYQFTNDGSLV